MRKAGLDMDTELIVKLIEDGVLDFNKLILKNYKQLGINESEAFVMIELNNQKKKGATFLNPSKLVKNLSLSIDELMAILEQLMKKGLVTIEMVINESGKEAEVFHMKKAISLIMDYYKKNIEDSIINNKTKKYGSQEEELVDLIETEFQKQLTPLEIEIIRKWVSEDRFETLEIKKAILDAIKANKYTLSYVDGILVKRRTSSKKAKEVAYKSEDAEALKTFFDSWQK
jgi:DNA replication protein